MYVVNNSFRALLVALIPLAVLHAVLLAMVMLGVKATEPTEFPPPDQVLTFYAIRLASDAGLLFAGQDQGAVSNGAVDVRPSIAKSIQNGAAAVFVRDVKTSFISVKTGSQIRHSRRKLLFWGVIDKAEVLVQTQPGCQLSQTRKVGFSVAHFAVQTGSARSSGAARAGSVVQITTRHNR